jgi:hypothetical protein
MLEIVNVNNVFLIRLSSRTQLESPIRILYKTITFIHSPAAGENSTPRLQPRRISKTSSG